MYTYRYLSLAEVDRGLLETYELQGVYHCKPAIIRAFTAAKGLKKGRGGTIRDLCLCDLNVVAASACSGSICVCVCVCVFNPSTAHARTRSCVCVLVQALTCHAPAFRAILRTCVCRARRRLCHTGGVSDAACVSEAIF